MSTTPTPEPTEAEIDAARDIVQRYNALGARGAARLLRTVIAAVCAVKDAEIANLTRWKNEMLSVEQWWQRVEDFIRSDPAAPLGYRVSDIALARLKERDAALALVGKLRETLQHAARTLDISGYWITDALAQIPASKSPAPYRTPTSRGKSRSKPGSKCTPVS